MRNHEMEHLHVPDGNSFVHAIRRVEELGKTFHIDLRIVGGAVSDALLSANHLAFDVPNHEVAVFGPLPSLYRNDDSMKDIDVLTLTPDQMRFQSFVDIVKYERMQHPAFPQVSIEPAIFDTWQTSKIKLPQINSAIRFRNQTTFLQIDSVYQKIHPDSLAPWTIRLENGVKYTMLHPFAHFLRHFLRSVSGIKQKDKGEKISGLLSVANQAFEAEVKAANEWEVQKRYAIQFEPWITFIDKMLSDKSFKLTLKRSFARSFWNHGGTLLAHSKLNEFSNRFSG